MKYLIIKSTLLCLYVIALCGCMSHKYEVVSAPLKLDSPRRPTLDITTLKKDAKPAFIIKSYVVSLNQCIDYANQQETLLGVFND